MENGRRQIVLNLENVYQMWYNIKEVSLVRNDVIHVRVSDDLKANVESILSDLGISLSYAVNIYLKQIEAKRGIPFDVVLPSQEKVKEIELLAKAINLTGGKEVSSYANRILSLYAQDLIDYETAVFALGRNLEWKIHIFTKTLMF